ncbi:kynurenine/alpha-aminoadipate aminotransferase, mitochondrial-like [Littorina saxatilis]|uniref:Kynurenine/alpha-aminoadipate aminotransferase, mitochondrial n=1 Tax=Littorina saxatilis TaxID=31220 RepID=A0AAN9FXG4_9CAEN
MNYSRFFNPTSLARQPSAIRVMTAIVASGPPSLISMAGGMPNADLFPIHEASLTLRDGSVLRIPPEQMKKALQYSATPGLPELVQWMKTLQKQMHNPPTRGISDPQRQLDVLITTGSQDGICKTMEACLQEGQNVLLETPTYSGTLSIVKPMRPKMLGIKSDKDGLDPAHLREVLSKWHPSDAKDDSSSIPRLLYLVPNGGNPTGAGLTLKRKKEIYELAQQYDLLILEDDPYYYLQFNEPYIPSLLSMDVDGRVVRFDSVSKLLSGGARVGVVTGPKAVLERINFHMQASVLHTSGLAQTCILSVLESMGQDGLRKHAHTVADFYLKQRDACIAAVEKHLTGLAEWSVPSGGMFLWIRLLHVKDTFSLITEKARAAEVIFVPGQAFMIDEAAPSPYLRASYSLVSPADMDKGFQRLADLLREQSKE